MSKEVVDLVNKHWREGNGEAAAAESSQQAGVAVAVPMDGFHLYRWQLDCFDDPKEAHARRGGVVLHSSRCKVLIAAACNTFWGARVARYK